MCGTSTTNDLGLTDKNSGCACGGHSHEQSDVQVHDQTAGPVIREHYQVNGMTCGHCVSSVTEELSGLEGVRSVSVDLNAGGTSRVMVVSSKPIPAETVRAAISEAGYDLLTAD